MDKPEKKKKEKEEKAEVDAIPGIGNAGTGPVGRGEDPVVCRGAVRLFFAYSLTFGVV